MRDLVIGDKIVNYLDTEEFLEVVYAYNSGHTRVVTVVPNGQSQEMEYEQRELFSMLTSGRYYLG